MPSPWELLQHDAARLHALMLRLVLRYDVADELTQELFLKLSRSTAYALANNPGAYARQAAIHLAMDWRRQQKREIARVPLDDRPAANPEVSVRIENAEEIARILDVAEELTELSRTAFLFRFVEGASYDEVAKAISRTPHQARGICHAAVSQIRSALLPKEICHDPHSRCPRSR